MDTIQQNLSLVLDLGQSYFRLGYSGDAEPRIETNSYYGVSSQSMIQEEIPDTIAPQSAETQFARTKFVFGREMDEVNPGFSYKKILNESNEVPEKEFISVFAEQLVSNLSIEQRSMPLLLSEDNMLKKEERLGYLQLFLETGVVPQIFLARKSLLSLYACGKTTGAVLDSGSYSTSISTIEEGFFVIEGYSKIGFGGEHITERIMLKLQDDPNKLLQEEILSQMAENLPENLHESQLEYYKRILARKMKHTLLAQEVTPGCNYQLPDGTTVSLENEVYELASSMFKPSDATSTSSMHELCESSLTKLTNNKLETKMFGSIILTGGNTSIGAYVDSCRREISELSNKLGLGSKMFAFPNERIRSNCVWVGGSILCSIDNHLQYFVTKQDLAEFGDTVVDRKLL
jgi:actin-related protein